MRTRDMIARVGAAACMLWGRPLHPGKTHSPNINSQEKFTRTGHRGTRRKESKGGIADGWWWSLASHRRRVVYRSMRPRPTACNEEEADSWVDHRLAGEPKAAWHKRAPTHGSGSMWRPMLRISALAAVGYLLGVHDMLFAALSDVRCVPAVVQAGHNVTCTITLVGSLHDAALSLTPIGTAGAIALLDDEAVANTYRITFATATAGEAGVRIAQSIFWSTSLVEVAAGQATTVGVACAPPSVAAGAQVRCTVTPVDVYGNAADVQKPANAPAGYFSVSRVGGARELSVHDTFVSFRAAEGEGGRAGVAITLNGRRVESTVAVITASHGPS